MFKTISLRPLEAATEAVVGGADAGELQRFSGVPVVRRHAQDDDVRHTAPVAAERRVVVEGVDDTLLSAMERLIRLRGFTAMMEMVNRAAMHLASAHRGEMTMRPWIP